ncbi:MAG: fibronectin type III domain-containing protein [Gemmatimonadales bacterium]|nr:fibronectin type III domain-containing protein [Gemmatimonadales bacterium]
MQPFSLREDLMQLHVRHFRTAAAAVLLAAGLAACGDDDNSGPPATPPAPVGLTATAATETSINVTWTAVSGATGYVLERAVGSGSQSFAQVGGSLTATTYTDTDVTTNTAYSYRVAAVNGNGTGTFSSPVSVTPAGPKVATISEDVAASRTLYADTVYTLSGFVKVANGATLTIQAGTTILGDVTVPGSSLFILRGARIDAQGTATAPIVFTSSRPAGQRQPGDWGGLLIIGNGIINRTPPVLTEGPAGETEEYSGGTDNADNSGTLRYVRIEFAGYDVSNGAGQELNSLSMYAVGSGTTLEYVQSLAGLDDSFEWWGGAVDGRYLVSYESGDDHFDWTEGYRGRNQFLIAFQSTRIPPAPNAGIPATDPQGFEADGCNGASCPAGFASEPFSVPVFANFTLVGPGTGTTPTESGDVGVVLRRGTGGYLTNGIVARWQSQGLSVRDDETNIMLTVLDSLNVANLLLAENTANYDVDGGDDFGVAGAFAADNHVVSAATAVSLFTSLTPTALDWTPAVGSAAAAGAGVVVIPTEYTGGFFGATLGNTTYFGAVDPAGPKWWQGWTNYATN